MLIERFAGFIENAPNFGHAIGYGIASMKDFALWVGSATRRAAGNKVFASVVRMTLLVWLAQFAIVTFRAAATGAWIGPTPSAIRFGAAAAGCATTLGVFFLLKNKGYSPARGFAVAAGLLAPLGALVVIVTQLAWLFGTDYYQSKFGLSIAEVVAFPASFVGQIIHTAEAFVWVYVAWAAMFAGIAFPRPEIDRGRAAEDDGESNRDSAIWVKERGTLFRVSVDTIDWAEAAGDYTVLHCGEQTYVITEVIGSLQRRVDPGTLMRVHRSAMVNFSRVRAVRRRVGRPGLWLTLSTGKEILVGPSFISEVLARIDKR